MRLLGLAFAVAWITAVAIEPMPNGPAPDYNMWLLPFDLLSIGSILGAVGALLAARSWGLRLGAVAGAGMLVATALCPSTGHHVVGWYTAVQAGLSAAILITSVNLARRAGATG